MLRRCLPVVALLAALAGPAAAVDPTGFSALELGPGARAQALGSAFSSLADDPTASFWNPAGLSRLNGIQVVATHNQSFEGIRQEYASFSKKYSEGTLGLSLGMVYNSDPLLGTDLNGDSVGTFGYHDVLATAAFGFRANEKLDVGAGVEYLASKIDDFSAGGFAINAGLRYFPGITNLSVGASVRHLGQGLTLDKARSGLPTTVQGGLSYIVSAGKGDLTLAGDVAKTRGDPRTHALVGLEYNQHDFLSLQAGYRSGFDSEAFSFGLGLGFSRFQFNYAMVPYKNDLGTSSRFALSYKGD